MIVASGRDPVMVKMPITGGGSDIEDGALITPGLTTNLGRVTLSPANGADAIGTLRGKHLNANDSTIGGTVWTFAEIELSDQYLLIESEYDQVTKLDVASSVTTNVVITSLEDNIDNGWFYSVAGTNANKLAFLTASAAGNADTKTAMGWDNTTDVIKILPIGHPLAFMTTDRTKLGNQPAVGTWTVFVVENYFEDDTHTKQLLNPTKHDNLTLSNPKFYSKLLIRNTAGHTID